MAIFKITSDMDSRPFNRGIDDMKRRTTRFSAGLGKLSAAVAGAFTARAVVMFATQAAKAAGDIEALEVQFAALGKSASGAARHIQEVADFSAGTPFEVDELAKMSRQLMAMSGGRLGGLDDLQKFGDAMAALGAPIEPVTRNIGKMFSLLQSNKAFAEPATELTNMGILLPDVAQKMERMRVAGKSSEKIWATFTDSLERFDGAMVKASKTVPGMVSTLKGDIQLLNAEIGEDFEPVTKEGLSLLDRAARKMKSVFRTNERIARISAAGGFFKALGGGDDAEEVFTTLKHIEGLEERHAKAEDARDAAEIKRLDRKKKELNLMRKLADVSKKIDTAKAGVTVKERPVDRLAKIGAFLGGTAAPGGRKEDQLLAETKVTNKILLTVAPDIADAYRKDRGMRD